MIKQEWLTAQLCAVLAWQLANPGVRQHRDMPPVPMAGQRVWHQFLALHISRTSSGFGPNPISHVEMESFGRMRRDEIRPFEVEMIRALDQKFLEVAAAAVPDSSEQQEREKPSSQAIMGAISRALGPPSDAQVMAAFDRAAAP